MCQAVLYNQTKIAFKDSKPSLPILTKKGSVLWLPWGRKIFENSNFPLGGWAKHSDIKTGKWDNCNPRPVRLAVRSFLDVDQEGHTTWYPLVNNCYIQALYGSFEEESRVYIVTIDAIGEYLKHPYWPRIIFDQKW